MKNFWLKLKKPIIALAPMAGITDSAFRQICKDFGADLVYSEMISVDGSHYKSEKTLELMKFSKKEKPIVIQLFGCKPELFAEAAKLAEKLGADGVDINFGCPAPKIYKSGGGVKLMRDLDLCYEIVKATCAAVKIPVSIKIRSSINLIDPRKKVTAPDLLERIKDLPVAAVMIHGRSYEKGFSGPVDFEIIKKVKQNFSGIVLGNGGIVNPEKAKEMIEQTGVDGLGLAQGVLGKPWLFKQVKDYLKKGKYKEYDFSKIKEVALAHAKLNFKLKGKQGILEMRKHLAWYCRGFEGASALRQKLIRVESLNDIKNILSSHLDK
ncbi:MAG: tRNA dihydrouridine synthase DusB [Patescibacteria group bacterium]|nr:tRNA dihydrouridine synthase DusB [Patescibacteria group bacterium]